MSTHPPAEAQYEELVRNPVTFDEKVKAFHRSFGTKYKIPVIGGTSLDLHRLFVEVTSRGGIEKVIKDRRWKEIIAAFSFPSTITSASFVLRKYYLSLLYHFEQVYYLRKEVLPVSLDDLASATMGNGLVSANVSDDGSASDQVTGNSDLVDGSTVIGTIESKFDSGYLVSVTIGSEKISGVLYHYSPSKNSIQNSNSLHIPSSIQNPSALPLARRRKRKRHQLGTKDPSQPKAKKSAYNYFFQEQYNILKPSYRGQERALTQKIGILWNRLTDVEKQVYKEKAARDKERYKAEMSQYISPNNQNGQIGL